MSHRAGKSDYLALFSESLPQFKIFTTWADPTHTYKIFSDMLLNGGIRIARSSDFMQQLQNEDQLRATQNGMAQAQGQFSQGANFRMLDQNMP